MSAETVKRNPLTKTRKTDKKLIAELAAGKPLTQAQIGQLTNLSQNRVSEILQEVKNNQEFQQFTENKDKVFENLQYRLINLADDNLLKTMLSKRGFTDAAILEDKIRNIRGLATEVHDVQIRALIASIDARKPVDNTVDNYDKSQAIEIQGKEASD
jgi:DNA-binding Lrp family transcriptional regulator